MKKLLCVLIFFYAAILYSQNDDIKELLALLHDKDFDVHQQGEKKLVKIGKAVIPELLEHIRDNTSKFIFREFEILKKVADKDAILPILQIAHLKSYYPEEICNIIKRMKEDQEVIPILLEALQMQQYQARVSVIMALGKITEHFSENALFWFEFGGNNENNEHLLKALEKVPTNIVFHIEKMLDDPNPQVRKIARKTLSDMRFAVGCCNTTCYHAKELAKILRNKHSHVREQAAFVLVHLDNISYELMEILYDFRNDDDVAVRRQIIRGFRNLNAIVYLQSALNDNSLEIRKYARKSLDEIASSKGE